MEKVYILLVHIKDYDENGSFYIEEHWQTYKSKEEAVKSKDNFKSMESCIYVELYEANSETL